jgi:copper chaperone CopZ
MKKILLLILILSGIQISAQSGIIKTTFKVFGNCTACKERIEEALDAPGIKSADWNIDTKELKLVYNPDKISIEQIHQLIAKAGHDTEKVKAPDSIYSKLPDCCLFREKPNTHHD